MKKLLVVVVLVAVAAGAFALDLSAGAGLSVAGSCEQFSADNYLFGLYDTYTRNLTTAPFAFSASLDVTYAQAAVGLRGNGNTHRKTATTSSGTTSTTESDDNRSAGFLSLELLGKFPFTVGKFRIFPLLGIEYDLNLWLKDQAGADLRSAMSDQEKSDLNQFWFKGGAGVDFSLAPDLSLRADLTLGFKLLNELEKQTIDTALTTLGATRASGIDTTVDFGVSVQYRFASIGKKR
jgi:hypothetical protein